MTKRFHTVSVRRRHPNDENPTAPLFKSSRSDRMLNAGEVLAERVNIQRVIYSVSVREKIMEHS